jgi:hypothetical protein
MAFSALFPLLTLHQILLSRIDNKPLAVVSNYQPCLKLEYKLSSGQLIFKFEVGECVSGITPHPKYDVSWCAIDGEPCTVGLSTSAMGRLWITDGALIMHWPMRRLCFNLGHCNGIG